ncbi:MAG: hypothetical protein U1E73_05245 [Planctomycetota bacterium]
MLPYPTDRRRLLMMVRAFVRDMNEFVRNDFPTTTYPREDDDPAYDKQMEEFLERLAVDAADDESGMEELGLGTESEAEVMDSLRENLQLLLAAGSWNERKMSAN